MKTERIVRFLGVVFVLFFLVAGQAIGSTYHVDVDASGADNGSSWGNAYNYLQDALAGAIAGDEIMVAQGSYTPGGSKTSTFQLIDGVTIKGGYAGHGEPDPNERDIEVYKTILSGDLNGNDEPNFVNNGENSYHVVIGSWTDETAVLDGFTITGGNAYDTGDYDNSNNNGAGMYIALGNPTLSNCTFSYNAAKYWGGGMFNTNSSPTLTNCTLTGNLSRNYGGGGMCNREEASPILINCTFSENSTDGAYGGGIYISHGHTTLINCKFNGNMADTKGNGGAIYNSGGATLTNCTFTGNSAIYHGGAINNHGSPTLTNCTFSGNSANGGGGMYNNVRSHPILTNCIFWDSEIGNSYDSMPVITYSNVEGGHPGIGNIDVYPQFVDANGPDNIVGTEDDNLRLLPSSLSIDAGDKSVVTAATDLDGNPRIMGCIVDMGAYENVVQDYILNTKLLMVPEGGTATFTVALTVDPQETFDVVVAFESGDFDITVESGELLSFDSSNYFQPQTVTLAAAEDIDRISRTALIYLSSPGICTGEVEAYEIDNDFPSVIYVDANAPGLGNGTNWENAFTDLQEALAVATAFPDTDIQFFVANGIYKPAGLSGSREATFQLTSGVVIKGGYAGYGEPDPNERDVEAYETILSGDLNGNDEHDFVNNYENSYHVVTSSGVDETAVLDGLTITAGNGSNGGGMFNESGNPTLLNCTFSGNSASDNGGGMYNVYSRAVLTNCIFSGNSAKNGGGICNLDCSSSILTNCTFINNSAEINGGGMYNYECCSGNSILTNCIFWNNSDKTGMSNSSQIYNSYFCNIVVNYSCIQGGYPGVGNIDVDPQFVNPCNGDCHLRSKGWQRYEGLLHPLGWWYDDVTSPCIDTGNPGSPLGGELLTIPCDPNHERGENLRINMGAYGGTAQASMGPYGWTLLGDLSNDGTVDYVDLAGQVEGWLISASDQSGDLSRDGIVNMADFVLMAQDWLQISDWVSLAYPSNPNPKDGSEDIAWDGTVLTWTAGKQTTYQDVYFGQSEDAVRNADSSSPEYKGQVGVDSFDPGSLELMKAYYWRVDQLDENSNLIVKGAVWRFSSIECLMIDDFDSYDIDGNSICDVWTDIIGWGDVQITLANDPYLSPANSMRLRCNVSYEPFYAIAVRSFSPAQDWTVLGVEVLTIHYYGTADNIGLPVFVTIGDGTTDANVVVTDVNTLAEDWQEINVSLPEIAAAGVDLNSVSYMEIGFGDGTDLGMSRVQWDIIYIDNIALYRPE